MINKYSKMVNTQPFEDDENATFICEGVVAYMNYAPLQDVHYWAMRPRENTFIKLELHINPSNHNHFVLAGTNFVYDVYMTPRTAGNLVVQMGDMIPQDTEQALRQLCKYVIECEMNSAQYHSSSFTYIYAKQDMNTRYYMLDIINRARNGIIEIKPEDLREFLCAYFTLMETRDSQIVRDTEEE